MNNKVNRSVVKQRMPYYIKCFYCGKILEGWTIKDLISEANSDGWLIDNNGNLLCDDDVHNVLQEQDI